jgi:translation initiation factor 2B subunit (eIF-2B alpha/beta/delta family)
MSADENNASGADNSAADQSGTQTPDVATLQTQLRDQQARATKAEQDNATLRGEIDALRPYVQYGNPEPAAAVATGGQSDEDVDPVVKLQAELADVRKRQDRTDANVTAETFLIRNPDLRSCQELLEVHLRQTPGRTVEERLEKAAAKTRQWLKDRDGKVLAEAEAKRTKKVKSEAALEGVMDGSVTPPISPEPEEKADLPTYSAMREAAQTGSHGGTP